MPNVSTIEMFLTLHARLAQLWVWSVFVLIHLLLAVLGLFALWWWQVPPAAVTEFLHTSAQTAPVRLFGWLGVSAAALLAFYWKGYKKISGKLLSRLFWKDLIDYSAE